MTEMERQMLEQLREAGEMSLSWLLGNGPYRAARWYAYQRLSDAGLIEKNWRNGGRTFVSLKEA